MNCPHCTEKYCQPVPCRPWNGDVWYCPHCLRTWETSAFRAWALGTSLVFAVVGVAAWLFR